MSSGTKEGIPPAQSCKFVKCLSLKSIHNITFLSSRRGWILSNDGCGVQRETKNSQKNIVVYIPFG